MNTGGEWSNPPAMAPTQQPIIDLQNVSMAYGGTDGVIALSETSLQIEKGEFVAIVGPSGCGKSSLLKLISGLHPPQSGSVRVSGEPVKGPLKICGMAFQNSMLLPWRTAIACRAFPAQSRRIQGNSSKVANDCRPFRL
jgi:NitT/TauT family transport system ATP-binding protein